MMGRKLEEGDWAKVYCAAKGIPAGSWSNTDIDVTFGNLGVEHKMICRKADRPIRESCGVTIMHPAGTRAIRIPDEKDPTSAARDILRQYGVLIARRRTLVSVINRYSNGGLTRAEAIRALGDECGFSKSAAGKRLPAIPVPSGTGDKEPDMRTGWLLWQTTLREFLYFEEPMVAPDPAAFEAEWKDRTSSGSRIGSRNLWIYDKRTGDKHFSVTTEAGAKIQPYFTVPMPKDPNLHYFVVQGEECGDGLVRVWLTETTADCLREMLGDLDPSALAAAVAKVEFKKAEQGTEILPFASLAVEVFMPAGAYAHLCEGFKGVSDEHNFKQLITALRG